MAKVGASVSMTLKITGSEYQFIKPEIKIDDIDTDKQIEPQLVLAEAALTQVWNKVFEIAAEEVKAALPQVELEKKVVGLEKTVDEMRKVIGKLLKDAN